MAKDKKIDYINIDCDSNYFNTLEQIKLRSNYLIQTVLDSAGNGRKVFEINTNFSDTDSSGNVRKILESNINFSDATAPSKISNTTKSVGFFSGKKILKDKLKVEVSSSVYNVSQTVVDSSGNSRNILASNIDIFSASIIDGYRNGVEITQEKHWTAGIVKITAGTPGHLLDKTLFGVNEFDLVSRDSYYEIEAFNAVNYLRSNESPGKNTVTIHEASDASSLSMNGTIEPIPIRPVVFGTSINFPFEPQGVRGEFGNGNVDLFRSSDQVLSVHEREVLRSKKPVFFLDVTDALGLTSGEITFTMSSSISAPLGFISSDVRIISPFEDDPLPRGNKFSPTYDDELKAVVAKIKPRQTSYLSEKEFSSTCGFVNESSETGVESIAFSNMSYNSNSSHRSLKRSLINLRDSESCVQKESMLNDNNTIKFSSQVI